MNVLIVILVIALLVVASLVYNKYQKNQGSNSKKMTPQEFREKQGDHLFDEYRQRDLPKPKK